MGWKYFRVFEYKSEMSEEIPAAFCDNITIESKTSIHSKKTDTYHKPFSFSFSYLPLPGQTLRRGSGKQPKGRYNTMLDKNKVRIGIAPIAWTEDDMPEMGAENSFLQTISEIALTGYVGTEIGCQFPRDPAILNKELGRRGVAAITGWISTYLNEQPMWWNERAFVDHMYFLKSIGATVINTSDQSFSIQHQWNTPLSRKKILNDDEWEVLAKGLDHLGKIAADEGMKIVYHHHMTTTVQTTSEIDRMLSMTDPKYVSMIYDTGHLTFSGEDPIEILKKHHDRIGHVHLKNVRKAAMDKCYAENKSFLRSIPEGVFTVPGDPEGCVDFPAVFKLLDEYNYEGWLVVEAEQDPAIANPLDYAKMAREYVRKHIGF